MKFITEMTRNQKRAMLALALVCTTQYLGGFYYTCMPYIVNQYTAMGYDEMSVQRLMSIGAYVSLPFGFLIGPLAMKFNKKYLHTISVGAMAVHYVIFYFAGSTSAPLWVLYAGVIASNITAGIGLALTNATISDYFPADQRATMNANFTALMSGGNMIFNVIGGRLAAVDGGTKWYNAFFLGFWIIIAAVGYFIFMPKSPDEVQKGDVSKDETGNTPELLNNLPAWEKGFIPVKTFALIACGIMTSFSITANMNHLSLFIVNDYALGSTAESGLAASMGQFTSLFIGFTYAFWAKFLKRYIHIFGLVTIAIAYYLISAFGPTNLYVVYSGAIMIQFGFNLLNPYYMGRIMYVTPKKWLPVALSLSNVGIQLAIAIALDIFNAFTNTLGGEGRHMYLAGGFCTSAVIAVAFFVYFIMKSPREKEEAAALKTIADSMES